MDRVSKIANLYIATLRAIYLTGQFSHWTTRGLGAYGEHLLFERLYGNAQKDADLAAEKFIGLLGEDACDYELQAKYIHDLQAKYADHAMEKLELSLAIVKDFLAFSDQVYAEMEKEGVLSLGLDDCIMGIASNQEEACYLLQQSLAQSKVSDE